MTEPEYVSFGFGDETSYPLDESRNRDELISTFQEVFRHSPYEEDWSYEDVDSFLGSMQETDYEGFLALDGDDVIGFAWGRILEPGDAEKFPDELQEADTDYFDGSTFYFEELGVAPGHRGQRIGKKLKRKELERVKERKDVSRGLMRTQYNGEELIEVEEDVEAYGDNTRKLGLDSDLGFSPVKVDDAPVIEPVDLVGRAESDERIYMERDLS